MKLHRNGTNWNRDERNKTNDNWEEIEGNYNNVVENVSDKAFDKVVDSAKLNWKEPVDTYEDLPNTAQNGETRMVRGGDEAGKSYRFNGLKWIEIQEIDATAINEIDSRLTSQLVNKANIGMVNDFRNNYYKGPVVAFVFDDGRFEMWEIFKDVFESEGVPANVPVVTGSIDSNPNYMTSEQLKELQNLGWCICSHTVTHSNVNELSDERIKEEYGQSSKWLKERGFSHDIIVYPYGSTSAKARKIASKYYKMGVNIVRNNLSNDIPDIDNLNLNRLAGLSQPSGASPTYDEIKQRFDFGVERNELMIYEDHPQYPDWTSEKIKELRTFIRYIKSKGVPIVTLEDAFQMKCNIIDVGERSEGNFYKLHRNGDISNGDNVFHFAKSDTYKVSDSADIYPENKITKFRVNSNFEGLPLQTSGEITMDKTTPYPNNWKMDFYTNGQVFYRMWRDNEWTRWYSYGELIGDAHSTLLPSPGQGNWRRMMLVRGHDGHEDKLVVCTRNADSTFSWKEISLSEYS